MAIVKRAKVRIANIFLEELLHGRLAPATSNAPDDLRVLGVVQPEHAVGHWFEAIVESDTFAPVPEMAEYPPMDPPIEFSRKVPP